MYDADEKLEDAVAVLTSRFYNNLSYNWRDGDSIAAYYASDAVRASLLVLWFYSLDCVVCYAVS
jgi:hypothetical protein